MDTRSEAETAAAIERDAHHLAAIVQSSDDAIISKDLNGTIRSWNPAAERLFGYAAAEVIGKSIRVLIPTDRQSEEDRVLSTIRRGETVDHFETVRLRKDGTEVPISLTVSPIRSSTGQVIGASKIARDISRLQSAQRDAQRLAAIVDSSDDAIISKNLESIVTSWNLGAERIFGFTQEEMIGQSIRRLIPRDRQREEDEVLAKIKRGERVEHYETVRLHKNGAPVAVSLTVSPIKAADGTILGASKIARDISDRVRAEEERLRLLTIARNASRLKDEFLATLSHELRTPLNAIVGYVRMMQSGLLTGEKATHALDVVGRNVTSLTQIVEDVLDVSRIISGKLRLDLQPVDLAVIVRSAIDTVRPAAEAKGVALAVIAAPQTPSVLADPERLRQMLWNLLSNAVKFTERGGRVSVRVESSVNSVDVIVADTGVGISPEFLPFAFDPFRQADAGASRVHGGLGLGLAITKHLAELQGGRVSATSDGPGTGSTFRIALPAQSRDAIESRPAPSLATLQQSQNIVVPRLDHVRVLVVDDDRDSLALTREILETTGAIVTIADSAKAALRSLEDALPDVVIADLAMPRVSGFELVEAIRQSPRASIRTLPAIALTAYARSEDRARALQSGFHMHLPKPVDPASLMAAVASLVQRDES